MPSAKIQPQFFLGSGEEIYLLLVFTIYGHVTMASADIQWLFHSSDQVMSYGPLVFLQ